MTHATNPEIGKTFRTGSFETNYHDVGSGVGAPVLLLHGSGAGVSAWANWRGLIPVLSENFRVIAPDLVGFGYTTLPDLSGSRSSTPGSIRSSRCSMDWVSRRCTSSGTRSVVGLPFISPPDSLSGSTESYSWARVE